MIEDIQAETLFQVAQTSFLEGSPWSLEQFKGQLNQENTVIFTKENTDGLQGFIMWQVIYDEAELLLIAVDDKHKRQSVGSTLFIESLAKLEKITSFYLEVRQTNISAIKLYEKYHFKMIGTRKNYYTSPREDAVIMQLKR